MGDRVGVGVQQGEAVAGAAQHQGLQLAGAERDSAQERGEVGERARMAVRAPRGGAR